MDSRNAFYLAYLVFQLFYRAVATTPEITSDSIITYMLSVAWIPHDIHIYAYVRACVCACVRACSERALSRCQVQSWRREDHKTPGVSEQAERDQVHDASSYSGTGERRPARSRVDQRRAEVGGRRGGQRENWPSANCSQRLVGSCHNRQFIFVCTFGWSRDAQLHMSGWLQCLFLVETHRHVLR